MQTKLSLVKAAFLAGDFKKALSLAAKFQDLGTQRDAIKRAHECHVNPRFYAQLGVDIENAKQAGIDALEERYGFTAQQLADQRAKQISNGE